MKLSLMAMFALAHATGNNDQQQYEIKSYDLHTKNKQTCEELRDTVYEASSNFYNPMTFKLIKDLSQIFEAPSTQNMQNNLKKFEKQNCYENPFLPAIDRDLIKKLDQDLKK